MEHAANSENNKESKRELRARTKAAQFNTDIELIQKGAMYKTCNRWNVSNISRDGVRQHQKQISNREQRTCFLSKQQHNKPVKENEGHL